jgi:uncharacterized Tic20 family protein
MAGMTQPPPYPGPAYPPPMYVQRRPATGAIAWWLGLLVLILIPIISNIAATVAVLVYRSSVRQTLTPLGHEVARRAANWQLSLLLYSVLLFGTHILLLFTLADGEGSTTFFPIGIAITVLFLVGVYGLVLTVVSGLRANQGRLTPAVGAIPFIRRTVS